MATRLAGVARRPATLRVAPNYRRNSMPEGRKMVQSSPASAGAGDISETELSRERGNLLTPPARIQRVHPKRQLFSTPVNKFTAKAALPSPNLARIRTCLDELRQTPARPVKISPKAVSMEDLTPCNKRIRRECSDNPSPCVALRGRERERERAALRIGVFMLVAAWRRRREDLRCARRTLEFQVSGAERLRLQVCALKSLLDADNAKVRLAMREIDRLKQLVRDKDAEKAVLEKEKCALEQDICASEDRASEMSIGWRECRSELKEAQRALVREAAARRAAQCKIESLETEVSRRAAEAAALRRLAAAAAADLRALHQARAGAERRCAELRGELERARRRWLPAPLHRLVLAARACLPRSLAAAALWALAPARHGC